MQRRPVATYIALFFAIPPYLMTVSWAFFAANEPWEEITFWIFVVIAWWFHCRGEYIQIQRAITQRKIRTLERITLDG